MIIGGASEHEDLPGWTVAHDGILLHTSFADRSSSITRLPCDPAISALSVCSLSPPKPQHGVSSFGARKNHAQASIRVP